MASSTTSYARFQSPRPNTGVRETRSVGTSKLAVCGEDLCLRGGRRIDVRRGDGTAYDNRDVVCTSTIERILQQIFAHLLRRFHRAQTLGDSLIGYVLRKTVGAEQVSRRP